MPSSDRYSSPRADSSLSYVYNHPDAVDYLAEALCIDHPHFEKSERSFREWVSRDRANRGAFERAVAWRPSYDLARDITCTGFGVELGHDLNLENTDTSKNTRDAIRAARTRAPQHQRITVYLQRQLSGFPHESRMAVFNSAPKARRVWAKANTVLICESTPGEQNKIIDGLRLQALEIQFAASTDERAAASATVTAAENILINVFESILRAWRRHITQLSVTHATLEDQVYERPADDSQSGALWRMSQHALEMAKLVNRHSTLCQDVQEYFNHFAERDEDEEWLDDILKMFRQSSTTIREDFIAPTEQLIDLVRAPYRTTVTSSPMLLGIQINLNTGFSAKS